MSPKAEELLEQFILQKYLLLKRAGVTKKLEWDLAVRSFGKVMEEVATIIQDWDVTPALLMESVFAQARKQKFPNGPMPNMLKSVKYLTAALSNYLELPTEAIRDRQTMARLFASLDEAYATSQSKLCDTPTKVAMHSSEPVEFKFLRLKEMGDSDMARMLAPLLLRKMEGNGKLSAWMETKGCGYCTVAESYNS